MGKKARRSRESAQPVTQAEVKAEAKPMATPEMTQQESTSFYQYPKFVREHKTSVSLILSLLVVCLIAYGAYEVRTATSNEPYFLGADDPYLWSRVTGYIVSGNPPPYDFLRLQLNPPAFGDIGLFPYIGAWFYYAAHSVTGVDFYRSMFYFSPFFAALSVFPAFWIGRELHSDKAGIFAAFFVGFTPSFIFRSMGGYYDTDAPIMLFSTLVVALFLASYNRVDAKSWKKPLPLILAAFAGIVMVLFAMVWTGYAYLPWLFLGLFGLHWIYQVVVTEGNGIKGKFKNTWPFFRAHTLVFVVMFAVGLILWYALNPMLAINWTRSPVAEVLSVTSFFQTAKAEGGIFPNVWISISEEMGASFNEVVARVDPIIFAFGIIGLIFLFVMFIQNFKKKSIYPATFIFMSLWILPTLFGSIWAVRFVQMLAFPMAICAGIAIGVLLEAFFKAGKYGDNKVLMERLAIALTIIFLGYLSYSLLLAGLPQNVALWEQVYPFALAALISLAVLIELTLNLDKVETYKLAAMIISAVVVGAALLVLVFLKYPSGYNSIYSVTDATTHSFGSGVTSGWVTSMDWLKNNSAQCSVTATYWDPGYLINALSGTRTIYDGGSQNTPRTSPITDLNGLDCMKDRQGYLTQVNGTSYCVTTRMQDMAGSLFTSDEVKAAKIIESYRGDCKEMYFLASNDLIGKSQWWTYFSNWDPQKGQGIAYPYIVQSLTNQQPLMLENGTALIYGPFYIKITTKDGETSIEPLLLQNGQYFGIKTLIIYNNGTEQTMTYPNAQVPGTLWVDPSLRVVVYMPEQIEKSMFTRAFFFEGADFKYFKEVYSNAEVKIFKLDIDKLKEDYPEVK